MKVAILSTYLGLGTAISFLAGREPGTLPEEPARELAPTLVVVAAFLICYQLLDVMGVGSSKHATQGHLAGLRHADCAARPPAAEVYLAQRALTNQGEQLPVFLAGALGCALTVDGTVASILAAAWAGLRVRYALAYRAAGDLTHEQTMARIVRYTVPAYFLSTSMVAATGVHALRCLLH